MGVYPEITLKDARRKRDEAWRLLLNGIDPGIHLNAVKAARIKDSETLKIVAREWFEKHKATWTANQAERIIRRLERDIFPWIGKYPIEKLKNPTCSRPFARSRIAAYWRRRTGRYRIVDKYSGTGLRPGAANATFRRI